MYHGVPTRLNASSCGIIKVQTNTVRDTNKLIENQHRHTVFELKYRLSPRSPTLIMPFEVKKMFEGLISVTTIQKSECKYIVVHIQ